MDEDNIITLNDENGNEVEFEFLDLIPYRQNEYVVLLPIGDSDGQVVILQLKEIDDEKHKKLTGHSNKNILAMAQYVASKGVHLWIRHVLVPGLTDDADGLRALDAFIKTLPTVRRVEILPYHTLGLFKWQNLGIPYPLDGVRVPTAEEIAAIDLALIAPESLQQETAEGLTLESTLGTDEPERALVEHITLRDAIDTLPERERQTILLRFFKCLTQEQTARILGVSQVQVSRLERRSLQKLRSLPNRPKRPSRCRRPLHRKRRMHRTRRTDLIQMERSECRGGKF